MQMGTFLGMRVVVGGDQMLEPDWRVGLRLLRDPVFEERLHVLPNRLLNRSRRDPASLCQLDFVAKRCLAAYSVSRTTLSAEEIVVLVQDAFRCEGRRRPRREMPANDLVDWSHVYEISHQFDLSRVMLS
jgi:hypothetical protein